VFKIPKKRKSDQEYSKRMLSKILNHSMLMLWGTYLLAWFGKTEIAESLSKTIVSSVIAVMVGYLAKSVIENISKNTTAFGNNTDLLASPDKKDDQSQDRCSENEHINNYKDC